MADEEKGPRVSPAGVSKKRRLGLFRLGGFGSVDLLKLAQKALEVKDGSSKR